MKIGIGFAIVLFVGCIGADVTFGFLESKTALLENKFEGTMVNIKIIEVGEGTDKETEHEDSMDGIGYPTLDSDTFLKKEVKVLNYYNPPEFKATDIFVRVRLVPILRDHNGANMGSVDVEYQYPRGSHWKQKDDCYYYKSILKKGNTSAPVITGVKAVSEIPEGSYVEVQVLAEGIQAYPLKNQVISVEETPVYERWGVYPFDL